MYDDDVNIYLNLTNKRPEILNFYAQYTFRAKMCVGHLSIKYGIYFYLENARQ